MGWNITFLMILMILAAVTNGTEKCKPFKALVIWHTSSGGDMSYVEGKRLLIFFIDGLPEGTDVILMTVGPDANIDKQFKKNAKDTTWMEEISLHKPGTSGNHVIPSNKISEAVLKYLDQNKTPTSAEEVFLIVTNKSVIDNEGRVKEALRKKTTFVVVYGNQTDDRNVWADLATDNYHLKVFQDDNRNSTIKSLRKLSCKDSNNYIQDTDLGVTTPASDQINLKTVIDSVTKITSLIYVVIFLLVLLVVCLGPKFIKKARTIFEKVVCKEGNVQNALELAKPPNHCRDSMPHQPVENDNTNHTRDSMPHQAVENDNSENECDTELPERRSNNLSTAGNESESYFVVRRQGIPYPTEIRPVINPETRALITEENVDCETSYTT